MSSTVPGTYTSSTLTSSEVWVNVCVCEGGCDGGSVYYVFVRLHTYVSGEG